MSSANKDHFIFIFPVCRSFISFLIILVRTSGTTSDSSEGGHFALSPISGSFSKN